MSKGGLNNERLIAAELSPDELREYLNNIIDAEIRKPYKKMDTDIIDECTKWLLELNGQEVKIPEEVVKQRAKSIMAEHYKPRNERFKLKYMKSFAVAACIVILASVQFIAVAAFGVNLFEWTKDTFLSLISTEIQREDIDFTASGAREYKTAEEFNLAENIDIIIPTWLPDNIKIESIKYSYNYNEQRINLIYNDNTTSLIIKLNTSIHNIYDAKIYENDNIIYYIFKDSNIIWWEYDGNFYNFTCGFDISGCADNIIKNIK